MRILAIDPGTTKSAYVMYESLTKEIDHLGIYNNEDIAAIITSYHAEHMAIEMVACYGMAVGESTFETCLWIGRFIERWSRSHSEREYTKIYRKEVKMHLCNSMRAKDGNVRQAIIDRYPATGGGKTPQIGIKSKQGPLYGVSTHVWPALGVAITYSETKL